MLLTELYQKNIQLKEIFLLWAFLKTTLGNFLEAA